MSPACTTAANTMREGTSFQIATILIATKFERLRQTDSAHRGLSLNRQARSERNQTNHVSFRLHAIPGTTWAMLQLRATFATSQSCRKWAILSPDLCSPMTNKAPLPTSFSFKLLDEKEETLSIRQESSSAMMCNPTKAHAFTCFNWDAGPKPNQLPEDHRLFLQKEEQELAITARTSLGHSIARKLCVDAHNPKHPEKATRPLPTTVASDLTPPDRWSLLPCFHKALSQLQY